MKVTTSVPPLLLSALFALAGVGVPGVALADTVQIQQLDETGSGTAFRRGRECLVLTAAHVIPNPSRKASVRDRTGATAEAQVVFHAPEPHDLALLQLAEGSPLACNERWPNSDWMATEQFRAGRELHFMRRERGGRETAIMMRWAGGSPTTLTLSPLDKVGAIASDSGSLVYAGDRPVGIVLRIDPNTGRVEVLRMDTIHGLLASYFEQDAGGLVSLDHVRQNGRDNANWKSYVSTWFGRDEAPPLAASNRPDVSCRVSVNVLDLRTTSVSNPERQQAQQRLNGCRNNILFRNSRTLVDACVSSARAELNSLPTSINATSIQMQVTVDTPNGVVHQALESFQFQSPQDRTRTRADLELAVLVQAFGNIAPGLLREAGCMRSVSPPPAPQRQPARPRRSS